MPSPLGFAGSGSRFQPSLIRGRQIALLPSPLYTGGAYWFDAEQYNNSGPWPKYASSSVLAPGYGGGPTLHGLGGAAQLSGSVGWSISPNGRPAFRNAAGSSTYIKSRNFQPAISGLNQDGNGDNVPDTYTVACAVRPIYASAPSYGCVWRVIGTGNAAVYLNSGFFSLFLGGSLFGTTAPVLNETNVVVAVFNGTSAKLYTRNRNGLVTTYSGGYSAYQYFGTGAIWFAGDNYSNQEWPGLFEGAQVWNRDLSAGEVDQVSLLMYRGEWIDNPRPLPSAMSMFWMPGISVTTVSDTDTGTGSDTGSVGVISPISGSDTGTGTEGTPTLAVALTTATDTGSGAETGTSPVFGYIGSDTGTGTDTGTLGILTVVTGSDTGTGTDATSLISVILSNPETGTGTDATGSLINPITATDSGFGFDTGSPITAISSADTGTGTDAYLQLVYLISTGDTGVGGDVTTGTAEQVAVSDSGTGTETTSIVEQVTASDLGVSADASTLVASVSGSDPRTGTDTGVLILPILGSDTGSTTDTGSVLQLASISVSESPTTTETATVSPLLVGTESPTGTDAYSLKALVPGTETGTASETANVALVVNQSDSATGTDTGSLVTFNAISASDSGTGTDSSLLRWVISGSDTGTATDSSGLITHDLKFVSESGTGVDSAAVVATLASSDFARGNEGLLYVGPPPTAVAMSVSPSIIRLGDRVTVRFTATDLPVSPPVLSFISGGTVFNYQAYLVELPNVFGATVSLPPTAPDGTFSVEATYQGVSGTYYLGSGSLSLIQGGDAGGRILSMASIERPEGRYVIAHLDSGHLVQGSNPHL